LTGFLRVATGSGLPGRLAGRDDQDMTRALVVSDLQESFRQQPLWPYVSDPAIVSQVSRLVSAARDNGDLVVWVLHAEPGSDTVFDPASGHVRLIDGLDPRDGEPVITKTSINAFTTTNLQQRLTTLGIREVIICGIQTEQCCETTARVASDLGFEVTFAIDATATFPIPHPDSPPDLSPEAIVADPRTMSTEDIIGRTEYMLAGRFATVRRVAELLTPVAA
jgi:nicotinamidase-related amidase